MDEITLLRAQLEQVLDESRNVRRPKVDGNGDYRYRAARDR